MPSGRLPLLIKIISLFTLIGGLSIIGSLFVDIGRPSGSVSIGFYLLRLLVGATAIAAAYGISKKERWAIWLFGAITMIGFYFNPITGVIPGLVFIYLLTVRHVFKPSFLDMHPPHHERR